MNGRPAARPGPEPRRRLLVSGASGFIGRALVGELAGRMQHAVRALARRTPSELSAHVEYVVGGTWTPETGFASALADVDAVIHLAARAHVLDETARDPLAAFRRVNVECTVNLARQAADAGVRRFVFISSVGVNGNESGDCPFSEADEPCPREAYAVSKLEAETALRALATKGGMDVTIIRPPLVYGADAPGNFGRLCSMVRRGLPLPLGGLTNPRSFVGLANVVDFIITCTDHPAAANETFLVSDGRDLSTSELVERMARALGRPARLVTVPRSLLLAGAALVGKRTTVERLMCTLQVDISRARRVLSWTPPVSLEEGLRHIANPACRYTRLPA